MINLLLITIFIANIISVNDLIKLLPAGGWEKLLILNNQITVIGKDRKKFNILSLNSFKLSSIKIESNPWLFFAKDDEIGLLYFSDNISEIVTYSREGTPKQRYVLENKGRYLDFYYSKNEDDIYCMNIDLTLAPIFKISSLKKRKQIISINIKKLKAPGRLASPLTAINDNKIFITNKDDYIIAVYNHLGKYLYSFRNENFTNPPYTEEEFSKLPDLARMATNKEDSPPALFDIACDEKYLAVLRYPRNSIIIDIFNITGTLQKTIKIEENKCRVVDLIIKNDMLYILAANNEVFRIITKEI